MPALKAFFAGEINTRSFVTVACTIGFTLEHTVGDWSPFRPPCQGQSSLLAIHKTFLCKIHYYDAVIDS